MEPLRATYRLLVAPGDARERAEALALEQTVELPRDAIRDGFVERKILPRIEDVQADPERGMRVTVAFPVETTGLEPAQLLNVLFGNSSLREDVELADVTLPSELLTALGGPRLGVEGIRKTTDAFNRPLTCTALKPMGLSPESLAELCYRFARAGVDVIKDDHGLADQSFCPFAERVPACQTAIERAAQDTGHRSVYAPNLSGTPTKLVRQLDQAQELGVGAVLVSPMLIGLPAFWELVRERAEVPVLAHPALGGAARIEPHVLLGHLFRVLGADAVIYPHTGGRFSYGPEVCRRIAVRLREPLNGIRPSLPVPAGGIQLERVGEVVKFYGRDAMLLVGGSLYMAGDDLEKQTRSFVERVRLATTQEEG